MRKILDYWLDKGADGFRVDMAASLVKQGRDDQGLGTPGTTVLWRELREWWDEHYPDRLLVAEWSAPEHSIPAGFHLDFMMHFNAPGYPSLFFNGVGSIPAKEGPCYFDPKGGGRLEIFRESYARQLSAIHGLGYVSLPSANHDIQRLRCGVRDGVEQLKPAWVFLLTQAGPPTIYYGDEIGMRYVPETPPKEGSTLMGITAVNAGTADGERAGTRTPMQWDDSDAAGFSKAPAHKFYLPLDPDPGRPSVSAQENDPDSLLSFVKQLLELRTRHPVLASDAEYEILSPLENAYPFVCLRRLVGQAALIVVNPTDTPQRVDLPLTARFSRELLNHGVTLTPNDDQVIVSAVPFGYAIYLSSVFRAEALVIAPSKD
jgi:maltose alpha-D-glucosyltransferase/alpha-amylase